MAAATLRTEAALCHTFGCRLVAAAVLAAPLGAVRCNHGVARARIRRAVENKFSTHSLFSRRYSRTPHLLPGTRQSSHVCILGGRESETNKQPMPGMIVALPRARRDSWSWADIRRDSSMAGGRH